MAQTFAVVVKKTKLTEEMTEVLENAFLIDAAAVKSVSVINGRQNSRSDCLR